MCFHDSYGRVDVGSLIRIMILACAAHAHNFGMTGTDESVQVLTQKNWKSPVIVLDIFKTGVTSMRWQKWFTETGQTIIVTGQTHTCMHTHTLTYTHNACACAHTHTHTHTQNACTLSFSVSLCVMFFVLRTSHKITASTSDIHCFLYIIADLN